MSLPEALQVTVLIKASKALKTSLLSLFSLLAFTGASAGGENQNEQEPPDLASLPGMAYRRPANPSSGLIFCSDYAEEFLGYSADELLSEPRLPFYRLVHPDDRDRVRREIERSVEDGRSFHVSYRMLTRNKQTTVVEDRGRVIGRDGPSGSDQRDAVPTIEGLILPAAHRSGQVYRPGEGTVGTDHTVTKFDFLTNLPNRHWFLEQLDARIQSTIEDEDSRFDQYGLALLDLDDFQQLNDLYGRDAGDYVIKQFGTLLQNRFGNRALLGRISGDRFAILLPVDDTEDVTAFLKERLGEFRCTFRYNGNKITQSFSLGISVFPEHGTTPEDVVTSANRALDRVKNDVGANVTLADPSDSDSLKEKLDARERILDALENDRVRVFYQPIKDARDGTNVMHEALLRYETESAKILSPESFKDVVDDSEITRRIDRWVLRNVLEDFADRVGTEAFPRIAVNMFPSTLVDESTFPELDELLSDYDFPPEKLVVEIPETLMLSHRDRATDNIRSAAREFEFQFALDDFGVGHGSFKSLNTLPISYLKIDGSFVQDLANNAVEQKFVEMTAGLARQMDLNVVAEWIETRKTADRLQELGVPFQQGYYYSDPSPIEEIIQKYD